ncbi:MAG: hypothetical protein ABSB42_19740 [Tepidisphaeraceae bacterium]
MAANRILLRTLLARQLPAERRATAGRDLFRTGLDAMDELAPHGALRCGAIHELLFDCGGKASVSPPQSLALILARAAQAATGGVIVWSDPRRQLHPTAVSAAGIDLRRMILLRPRNAAQEISALTECLRCKGVSATVTHLDRLSDIEARRLQLAAENGGGVGIFLRPRLKGSASNYAAATRWLVRPAAEGFASALEADDSQSWIVELLHGHGGRLGSSVLLEVDRETGDVRASAQLADRPAAAPQSRATA